MTNNKPNLTPTGPGWWYRDEVEPDMRIVWVSFVTAAGLVSYVSKWGNQYDETNDKWLGPVPMPGTFAPRELFDDMRRMLERIRPAMGTPADRVLARANEWNNANPIPDEATP